MLMLLCNIVGGILMKLSMWNFKDWYQKHGLDCSYQISGNRIAIESVEFGSRSSVKDTDPSVAYIIPGEYLGHLCRSALCCAGDIIQFPAASDFPRQSPRIPDGRLGSSSVVDCIFFCSKGRRCDFPVLLYTQSPRSSAYGSAEKSLI